MVVSVSLGLHDVLIAGKSIPVVHVAERLNELVHDTVVPELLLVDHVRALLNYMVIADAIWQLELVVVFEVVHPHALLLYLGGTQVGTSRYRGLLVVYILNSLSELLLSEMREEPAGHDPFPLPLLPDLVVPEPLEGVSELLPVQRHVLWQGMRAIRVLR